LRKLFEELPSSSRREETLFVIVADHGESFMEHRQMQHGRSAYQSELRVPLLFHWPSKWGRGERRSEPVCSIDVMPTILALAGLPIPKEAHGTPLLSSMTRREHPCFSVGAMDWVTLRPMLVALRTRSRKLIYDRKRDAYELYELRDDPGEGRNLDGQLDSQTTEQLAVMKQALQAWAHRWEPGGSGGQVELDEKTTDALRALGYIE
jgi:N-acetylglucosamine-6-sulfatase